MNVAVLKFGGTSVATPDQRAIALARIREEREADEQFEIEALADELKEKQEKIRGLEERRQVLYNRLLSHLHELPEQEPSTTNEQKAEPRPNAPSCPIVDPENWTTS